MKKVLIMICALVFIHAATYAQVPQSFSYQSIARKANGMPLTNTDISLRISIRDLTAIGTIVYQETHLATTNAFGLFTITIGEGTVVTGSFAAIDWSLGAKFIEVEADFNGGTTYVSMGASQLLSVPYALYSQNGTPGPIGPAGPQGNAGPAGVDGAQGPAGAQGLAGATGAQGAAGPAGTSGANGLDVLNGTSDPLPSTGADGEFYINTTTSTLFGPKAGGAWPTGVTLAGPAGAQGIQGPAGNDGSSGANGLNVLYGAADPLPGNGVDGEFYINSTTNNLFGPKSGGVWPTGISLVGPAGTAGVVGASGLNILNGNVDPGAGTGVDGEFYINTATNTLFGPKAGGAWPAGVLLVGPAGADGAANAWGLSGTSGTIDGTSFIGTTDNVAVSFRVNNQEAGRIDPAGPVYLGYQAGNINTNNSATAIGFQALSANTTGDANVANGYQAMFTNTIGGTNSATGTRALYANRTGYGNTANGYSAMYSNTTGQYNTAHGSQALFANMTGQLNTAIGFQAMATNVAGSTATAVGFGAMQNANSTSTDFINTNVALGYLALRGTSDPSSNTGLGNTVAGYQVMLNNTTGNNNTASGLNALQANTSGNDNTAIGRSALITNMTGSSNTALGSGADVGSAALSNATALGNGAIVSASNTMQLGNSSVTQVFAGTGTNATLVAGGLRIIGGSPAAGKVLTSDGAGVATWQAAAPNGWGLTGTSGTVNGTNFIGTTDNVPLTFRVNNTQAGRIEEGSTGNTFFGYRAGISNTGNLNTATGMDALRVSTGSFNTANGVNALYSNSTGTENIAVGTNALISNTIGAQNTAIGRSAMGHNVAGIAGTAVGNGAMLYTNDTPTPFLNSNVAVGFEALRGSITSSANTGLGNTAVGYQGMYFNSTGSNNTASGINALNRNTAGNNNTAIGSSTMISNSTGSNNTALGNFADVGSPALDNATAIGNGAIVVASNTMQLGNSAVTQVFAGTGNTATLVAGGLKITGGSPTAGKVLTSDATGVATWQAAAPSGWGLTGTSGSVDGTNFIGTTDNVAVNFRVNNEKAGRIEGSGSLSTFFGYQAGSANTGSLNTGSGVYALRLNTTGSSNTAIGVNALAFNLTGGENTAMGRNAMVFNKAGSGGTAVGYGAMENATDTSTPFVSTNVAVGYEALKGSSTVSANTGVGNTVMGYRVMFNNSSGSNNTASGLQTLRNNTAGNDNTAIGRAALFTNATGSNNTALGSGADVGSTALNNATAIGNGAIVAASNTMQLGNSAVTQVIAGTGANATLIAGGLKITGGSLAAGRVLTSDATGVATWQAAAPSGWGLTGTSGTVDGINFIGTTDAAPLNFRVGNIKAGKIDFLNNTFMGLESGKANATGSENVAFGTRSLLINTAGKDNVALGYDALANSTAGYNTAVGRSALSGNTTGAFNTAIGRGADVSAGNLVNATAIGSGAIVSASNTMQLGNSAVTQVFAGTGNTATLVAGGLKITGGSPATGKVLTSDAAGVATWQTAAVSGWGLTGTSGTVNGTNFIGTTDDVPLSFRVNNQHAGRISAFNTFLGYQAGISTTSAGSYNTASGQNALYTNNSGSSNTAAGVEALYSNSTGGSNTAVGRASLITNMTGSNNTALGNGADVGSSALTNATAIGNGAIVAASNTMQLGNSAVTQVFAGTGNTATLVAGGLKITGGSLAAGKVLTSDAAGVATWQAAAPSGWGLTGTSGTVEGTNFLGSTDNVALSFKVNNEKAGKIDHIANNTFLGHKAGNANTIGTDNTAFGKVALMSNTTGIGNTAAGYGALIMNGTGSGNTAYGHWALASNVAGLGGTAVGEGAMQNANNTSTTFINSNVAVGYEALRGPNTPSTNTGLGNTVVGYQGLISNSTGSNNTAGGLSALFNNSIGNENTAIGKGALSTNTTGSRNTALGYAADVGSSALTNATAIGSSAIVSASNTIQLGDSFVTKVIAGTGTNATLVAGGLQVLGGSPSVGKVLTSDTQGVATWQDFAGGWGLNGTTGTVHGTNFIGTTDDVPLSFRVNDTPSGRLEGGTTRNTFFGYQAGATNNGSGNTGSGANALYVNNSGNSNTATGKDALYSNSTGSYNTASGEGALTGNTVGVGNTAVGRIAMQTNAGGSSGTAVGYGAMQFANSSATLFVNYNVAVGYEALRGSPTASANTGIGNAVVGYRALFNNTTGSNNTASGLNSLQANTAGSGNTAIGKGALITNMTGSNNTALGNGADVGSAALTNATAIGNGAIVSVSNTMQFGNTSVSEATLGDGTSSILKVGEVRIGPGDYNYTSAKTRYLTLGNAAFVAAGPDGMTASRNVTIVPGIPIYVYTINGAAPGSVSSFTAQVNLPHGAVVTGLTGYVHDSNATYDLSVILTRQAVGTTAIDNLASITSTGAPSAATYTTTSVSNGTIDNDAYSYQVVFQSLINGGHAVYNVKLTYTVSRAD